MFGQDRKFVFLFLQTCLFKFFGSHLEDFLDFLFDHFDVATWTSAKSYNAKQVVDTVFANRPELRKQLVFEWCQEDCLIINIPQIKKIQSSMTNNEFQKRGRTEVFLKHAKRIWVSNEVANNCAIANAI